MEPITKQVPDWMQVAEVELVYKSKVKASERPVISNAKDAYELFLKHWGTDKLEFVEEFKVMLLNRACKVLGICGLSSGNVAGTVADPKLVFTAALKGNASFIMVCHNHPSGHLKPSQADLALTNRIKEAGRLFDLPLLDHLIISAEGYYSFSDEGLV